MPRRKAWAYSLVRKFSGKPARYGTERWLALEDGSAEKIAAVVIAAEAWASTGDTLEEDVRREVEAPSLAKKRAEDAEYQADAAAHRRKWSHLGRLRLVADLPSAYKPPKPLEEISQEHMAAYRRDRDYLASRRPGGDQDAS